ncbi:MAG: hypothetical protein FWD53_11395, partial [Phycisphaerales bacterium]|nr:hypothetical protein [Phycisphaerales bacterium]
MILAPMVCALGLFCLRGRGGDVLRKPLVVAGVLVACYASITLAMGKGGGGLTVPGNHHTINLAIIAIEILMAAFIIYVGVRAKNWLIVLLMLGQAGLMGWFEVTHGANLKVTHDLFVDKFAIIMALINGLVGGGICLYALGYMKDYHEGAGHKDVADRRPMFFTLLFVFMGAMFGLIFANNLMWLFFFWEITTL